MKMDVTREIRKEVYLIMCILGGWFGVHKFYEGKTGIGILYFFTGGLLGFGVIIDFLSHLTYPKRWISVNKKLLKEYRKSGLYRSVGNGNFGYGDFEYGFDDAFDGGFDD